MPDPVIIGAGPAGTRAAAVLVAAGLRPVVIDEAPASGGQIYRRQPPGFTRGDAVYGFEAAKARAIHGAFDGLRGKIDHRPGALAWDIKPGILHVLRDGRDETLPYDDVILATGAMDRIIPLPGWTLPGVFTLGGAQIALKAQGCLVGRRTVFVGTGPLLWLAAYQYRKAGGAVTVIDTTSFARKARPGLLSGGATFAKGLYYVAKLRTGGARIAEGATPIAIEGTTQVSAFRWRAGGREHRVECDAVAIGYGLKPEAQLADLAGVPFAWNEALRLWQPRHDEDGRTTVPGLFIAGDGGTIAGADMAEISGALAAFALLQDRGFSRGNAAPLRARRRKLARFRAALDAAFPFPAHLAQATADDTIVCRCEAITAGELRRHARDLGAQEVNRAKALSRVGMGRCQGRVCGLVAAEILARELDTSTEAIGYLRGQPPVKPLPLAVALR